MKMTHNHCDVNYLLFSDYFNFQSEYFEALKMEKGFEALGGKIHHEGLPLPINMPVKNINNNNLKKLIGCKYLYKYIQM